MIVHKISRDGRDVLVTLDYEAVEFIAGELPGSDGFTRDWWSAIVEPMLKQQQEAENDDGL